MKVHLYDWDGKALKESGTLEGLKGAVSAVAIAPNGTLLAAGDVSTFWFLSLLCDVKLRMMCVMRLCL